VETFCWDWTTAEKSWYDSFRIVPYSEAREAFDNVTFQETDADVTMIFSFF